MSHEYMTSVLKLLLADAGHHNGSGCTGFGATRCHPDDVFSRKSHVFQDNLNHILQVLQQHGYIAKELRC